jgi:hypothetical protein
MFDYSWIEAPCPNCGFVNDITLRQIRLEEKIICTGCHQTIQLVDEHVSSERGQREINKAVEKIKNVTIRIKI